VAVVLVGFMGAGKTTVGRLVADRLGLPFVDSDALVEQRLGRPIREVFAVEGEAFFREHEHAAIAEVLGGPDVVLSVGGGALGDPRTRELLRASDVVHLHVGYAESMARVRSDAGRPMLQRPDLEDLYAARLDVYAAAAAITVETDGRTSGAVADEVLAQLAGLERRDRA